MQVFARLLLPTYDPEIFARCIEAVAATAISFELCEDYCQSKDILIPETKSTFFIVIRKWVTFFPAETASELLGPTSSQELANRCQMQNLKCRNQICLSIFGMEGAISGLCTDLLAASLCLARVVRFIGQKM